MPFSLVIVVFLILEALILSSSAIMAWKSVCAPLPAVDNANVCNEGWSSKTSYEGRKTTNEWAEFCCDDGSTIPICKITCENGEGWSEISTCICSSKKQLPTIKDLLESYREIAIDENSDSDQFWLPKHGSQCTSRITGPPTRCLSDKAYDLFPVSKDEVLDRHNYWRSLVNPTAKDLESLEWDDDLALLAERWAAQCPEVHDSYADRQLPNRQSNGISWEYTGQNIYMSSDRQPIRNAIDSWSEERANFIYGRGSDGNGITGHYTQIVSERTTHVGCGSAYCPYSFLQFIQVCNYGPTGNFGDGAKFPYTAA